MLHRIAAAALAVCLAACSHSSEARAPGASGWTADVDALIAELESVHPEPYHSTTRDELLAAAAEYKVSLPEMSEWEATVGFQRLLALLTREGRDGHMLLKPADRPDLPWRMFPVQLHWFPDGVYVVAAKDDPGLVGARLVRVGALTTREAIAVIEPLITKDNAQTVRARVPAFLEAPDLLEGAGLDPVLTFESRGETVTPDMTPVDSAEHTRWAGFLHPYVRRLPPRGNALWLRKQDEDVRVRYLPDDLTLYVGFNLVQPPFDEAVARMSSILESKRVARVVLDLRHNPGGETGLYTPLLRAFRDPRVDRPGRLFALTSRVTFSAAANFLADLDNTTCVQIAGEPPGAAPRFWDDNDSIVLPYSGLEVGVATRWWGKGGARHPDASFEVDVPVPLRAADYFAGCDPVLEEVVALRNDACP